jgi:hypothetical protein
MWRSWEGREVFRHGIGAGTARAERRNGMPPRSLIWGGQESLLWVSVPAICRLLIMLGRGKCETHTRSTPFVACVECGRGVDWLTKRVLLLLLVLLGLGRVRGRDGENWAGPKWWAVAGVVDAGWWVR